MNEIFLQLFVPSVLKTFDIKVSKALRLYEIRDMLYDLLSQDIDVDVLKKSDPILCDRESGVIFNINLSVAELALRNGSQLMLI